MQFNVAKLKTALTEWLIVEELLGDAAFYSPVEWKARGETYCTDAELILVVDGSTLHTLLNFGGDHEEFDDLVESFGFFYELGEAWYLGFYPVDDYDFSAASGSYADKLRDPRWLRKADAVRRRASHRCQDCGAVASLDAHHCFYAPMRNGMEPWEYPWSALRALCRPCHEARQHAEIRMRAYLARLTRHQLDGLRQGLGHALYWFETDALMSFLSGAHPDPEAFLREAGRLLEKRRQED